MYANIVMFGTRAFLPTPIGTRREDVDVNRQIKVRSLLF